MNKCKATKKDGKECLATVQKDSDYCFFHDPNKEVERQLSSSKGGQLIPYVLDKTAETDNLGGISDLLGEVIANLQQMPASVPQSKALLAAIDAAVNLLKYNDLLRIEGGRKTMSMSLKEYLDSIPDEPARTLPYTADYIPPKEINTPHMEVAAPGYVEETPPQPTEEDIKNEERKQFIRMMSEKLKGATLNDQYVPEMGAREIKYY